MNREESNENMESVGSNESMNWFIDDVELYINDESTQQLSSSSLKAVVDDKHQLQPQKKRNNNNRSKSRGEGSDSPQSETVLSRTRHSRKKFSKQKDESTSSSNNNYSSKQQSSTIKMMGSSDSSNFIESMKSSQSRLSRSLSKSSAAQQQQQAATIQQHLDQSLGSSGDESGSGRSEAAMVAEQKFKDKNREHARNTRSRKKLYIETLKQAISDLSAERELVDHERSEALAKIATQASVRKHALRTMFYYRATGELSRDKWEAILDADFKMLLPVTPYRSFPPEEVINGQRHVVGIDAMIRDNASLSVMVQSIGRHRAVDAQGVRKEDSEVRVRYYSGLDDTVISGDSFMCRWILRTENAVECGACHECFKQGMVHAKFSANNKILRLEMSYDVMCFMQQLRRASGKRYFEVVPNTVSGATEDCDDPNDDSARIITLATPPYTIVKVSRGWCEVTGYSAVEAVGRTCKMLQGPETDPLQLEKLMTGIRTNSPSHCVFTNYTKEQEPFMNFLRVCPLYTGEVVSHFIGLVERVNDPRRLQMLEGTYMEGGLSRDDLSMNDAVSATDSNMAIGYPPSPLSSLSSSSSSYSSSLHSRTFQRKDSANTVKTSENHEPFVSAPRDSEPTSIPPPERPFDCESSSTDQSMSATDATNEESPSGSGSGTGSGSGNGSSPNRASEPLASLSGNTDRSDETASTNPPPILPSSVEKKDGAVR